MNTMRLKDETLANVVGGLDTVGGGGEPPPGVNFIYETTVVDNDHIFVALNKTDEIVLGPIMRETKILVDNGRVFVLKLGVTSGGGPA